MLPEILKSDLLKNIEEIKKKTPIVYFSKKQLEYNFSFFKEKLGFKNKDVFFSVKTNYEKPILKVLKSLNSNFEIASLGELELMKKYAIEAQRLIFSNPVKIPLHIEQAYKYGVNTFAYDTESELLKISKYAPNSNVFLRLAIQNIGAEWKLEDKFGASKNNALKLLSLAKKHKLKPTGIAIHVGWNNNNVENWKKTILEIEKILSHTKKEGIELNFINLGGGFPAHNIEQYKALTLIAGTITPLITKIKQRYNLNFIAEPGSFLVANTAVLALEIYDIIKRNNKLWIFANSGIMQGFAWILSNLTYQIIHSTQIEQQNMETTQFILTGPTLDSHDVFSDKAELPKNTQIGDILFISPAGAYINSSKKYNNYPFPKLKQIG